MEHQNHIDDIKRSSKQTHIVALILLTFTLVLFLQLVFKSRYVVITFVMVVLFLMRVAVKRRNSPNSLKLQDKINYTVRRAVSIFEKIRVEFSYLPFESFCSKFVDTTSNKRTTWSDRVLGEHTSPRYL